MSAIPARCPSPGDYITCDIASVPVLMIRQPDGSVRVLRNRCAHKGAKIVADWSGNAGRFIRCPYHNWSYRTDGSIAAIPLRQGYDGTGFRAVRGVRAACGRSPAKRYRGFVFARLSEDGPDFKSYFGDSLSSIDYMVDRSPEGEMEIAGGVLRYMHDSNWKMFVENLNDTMHPMAAHESSAGTAKELWSDQPADAPKPMAIEQLVPFAGSYDFFDKMGVRVFDNGHSYSGVHFSIHSVLCRGAGLRSGDAARLWRGAGEGHPGNGAPQHGLLPQPDDQRRDPDDPRRAADRGGQDADRKLELPPEGRPGHLLQAQRHLYAADQLADVGGRA